MEFLQLLVALIVGVGIGVVVAWFVLRARGQAEVSAALADEAAEAATARAEAANARADVAQARQDAAQARTEAAQAASRIEAARTNVAEAEGRVAQARQEVAEAHNEAAQVRALMAELSAQVAEAQAQRDAAQQQAADLLADRELMTTQFKNTSSELLEVQGRKADEVAEQRLKATGEALKPVQDALLLFHERLNQVEKERVELSADLRAQVQAVRLTGSELRAETAALVTALRKPQVRGAWGEMQLRRVVEVAGMVDRCDFDLQVSASTADGMLRPDMRVNLAGDKYVYVDAKVPLAAFLEAQEATDDRVRDEASARFGKNIKSHIDGLSSKQYWTLQSGSPEFVVMFLASDAFLHAGLEQMPHLHEYAASRNIIIATPSILIAMLRAIAYGWKQSALADSAAEVFTVGRELYERLSTMGGHFDKVGRSLGAAVKAYNSTVGSLETRVLVSARRLHDLNVSEADLKAVNPSTETPRTLAAPEFVAELDQAPTKEELPTAEPIAELEAAAETDGQPDESHDGQPAESLPEAAELTRSGDDDDDLAVNPPIQLEWRRATMGR